MFWNRKPKLPITPQDQIWVEESLSFLKDSLGEEIVLSVNTVLPTREFFKHEFDTSEADAYFILERCAELMFIPKDKVTLEFYSQENNYLDDGTLLSTTADIFGKSKGAAGTYEKKGKKATIRIETGQLKHPDSLIATIAHELAHEKLLGENRILKNDEYLTDLTAIVFGFGVFIANAKFQFTSGQGNGFGWQMKSQGYLPEQITAYAMASLSLKKNETDQEYSNYLDSSVSTFFEKSLSFLKSSENKKSPTTFWPYKAVSFAVEISDDPSGIAPTSKADFSPEELKAFRNKLLHAVGTSNLEEARSFLEQGVSPNFQVTFGNPLVVATMRNDVAMVQLLFQYGADVNYASDDLLANSPLIAACKEGNMLLVKELIALGADIHYTNPRGDGALQVAVKEGNTEMVSLLLDKGAHIESRTGFISAHLKTPLCLAVENNDENMVGFLVKKGARVKAIKKLTRHEIHPKMVKFLKARKYL